MGKDELQVSTESLTVVPDGEGGEVLRMAADGKVGQNCVSVLLFSHNCRKHAKLGSRSSTTKSLMLQAGASSFITRKCYPPLKHSTAHGACRCAH